MNRTTTYGIRLVCLVGLLLAGTLARGQRPLVRYLDKTHGTVDEIVTISGSGFSTNPSNMRVYFGGGIAQITYSSEHLLEVKVPNTATEGPIRVINLETGLSGSSREHFTLSYQGSLFEVDKLETPVNFPSGPGIYDLCGCDFNNDGLLDVATSQLSDNSIYLYLNKSTPINVSFTTTTINVGGATNNISCGDIDNDGKQDLLVSKAGSAGNGVIMLRNLTADGATALSFAPRVELPVSAGNTRRLVLKDLNQDGNADILLTDDSNNKLFIFQNNSTPGSFSFQPAQVFSPNVARLETSGLAVADLNNDGYPEIALSAFINPNVYLFTNESTPDGIAFSTPREVAVPGNLVNILSDDFDGDGKLDLAVTNLSRNQINLLRNTTEEDGGAVTFAPLTSVQSSLLAWGISSGDLNGDGQTDLVVGTVDNGRALTIHMNSSTPGNISFTTHSLPLAEKARNVLIGDINGDAKPDISLTSIDLFNLTVIRNENCIEPKLFPDQTVTICQGLSYQISATPAPGATFRWELDDVVVKEGPENFIDVSVQGNYNATIIANQGQCVTTSPGVVQLVTTGVIPAPPTITPPPVLCLGETLQLEATAIPNARYVWTGPNQLSDTLETNILEVEDFQPQNAGRYNVEVVLDGCQSGTVSTVAEVVNLPIISINNRGESNLCEGLETTLSVVDYTGYTYQWYRDESPIGGATLTNLTVSTEGEYQMEIQDALGCNEFSAPADIEVFTPPTALFEAPDSTCALEEINFLATAEVDSNAIVQYEWTLGNFDNGTGETLNYTYPGNGNFDVLLRVSYPLVPGCNSQITQPIHIAPAPRINISTTNDRVALCPIDSLVMSVESGFESYAWSTGALTRSIQITEAGTYQVQAVNALQCTAYDSISIGTLPLPELQVDASPATLLRGDTATLVASGAFVYLWEPPTGLSIDTGSVVYAFPQESIEYQLFGMNEEGCLDSTRFFLEVIPTREEPLPSVFSPNGDGIDDFWTFENVQAFDGCSLTILNRQGNIIFGPVSYENNWDGTYRGNPLPEGVYYYLFECDDGSSFTGSILLAR